MIGFGESYIAWLASTLVPSFVGLVVITRANRFVSSRILTAFALGIFLWFFVDTLGSSASLGVNDGFGGGFAQVALVLLFMLGLFGLTWIDRNQDIFSPEAAIGRFGIVIPVLVSVAMGIHGLGEGAGYSGTVFRTSTTSLLMAFGGLFPAIAYVLHKGLEPMVIGACYLVYGTRTAKSKGSSLGDLFLLTIVFVLPSLIGAAIGYFVIVDTTYYFALGAGVSVYAAFRLFGPIFRAGESSSLRDSMKIVLSILFGFGSIYFASLFHSIAPS